MQASSSRKIKTGAFVVGSLLILLILIFYIGKQKNLFSSTFSVYAQFKNISGLKVGNYVRFGGIDVGTVDNIGIINDTTVRVDFVLNENVHRFIKNDAIASIGSDGLMGDKLVQLGPGSNGAPEIKDGGQLRASDPADMDKMMARIGVIADNAASLTGGLSDLVAKINAGQGSLGRLVTSDKLAKQLESTVSTTKTTVANINQTATSVKDNMEAAKHSIFLRGFFRKKEKKRIEDSIAHAKHVADSLAGKKQ
ncbi:MAG: MCE family protein [Bacteroidetes bacterium]|nr:MCE family protein [Bacteroidota bacterium]